jgi:hypothetical protein
MVAAAGTAGALLVWPQWLAVEGSRQALLIQQERLEGLEDRLNSLRALTERLREWNQQDRRVMLPEELDAFPAHVRQVGEQSAVRATAVRVTNQSAPRWRSHAVQAGIWSARDAAAEGEVRPVWVKVVLHGDFDSIYRTVAELSGGTRLFVPDRWDLAPAREADDGELRAEVWGTVFVARPNPVADEAAPAAPAVLGRASVSGAGEITEPAEETARGKEG